MIFSKLLLIPVLALLACLIWQEQSFGHGRHLLQPSGVIRLQAPWQDGGIRHPRTYIKTNLISACAPGYAISCIESLLGAPIHNGHGGDGLFGAVDLPTSTDWDKAEADWPILAAHGGTATFKVIQLPDEKDPRRYVIIENEALNIRTQYTHLRFQPPGAFPPVGYISSRQVTAGEIIGYSTTREEGDPGQGAPHLHFEVFQKDGGEWKQVDLRYVELDGQRLFQNCTPNPYGTDRIQFWCNPVVGFEGLTQAEAGATNEANDQFGRSVAIGDFNGDGKDDLAVGTPNEDDDATDDGMVVVYYGSVLGITPGVERLGQKHTDARSENGDRFGSTLAVGDFNGDGKDDLAVGVPGENDEATDDGMVIVFYGSANGLISSVNGRFRAVKYERLGQKHADARSESEDCFGSALTAGDFNGDGKDDLAVGVPGENDAAANDGMVVVFYGSSSGLLQQEGGQWRAVAYERLGQKQVGAASESYDRFGSALASGDFNCDGRDDLAVGVPGEDDEATDDGMVVVFYGSQYGLLRKVNDQWRAVRYERLGQKQVDAFSESNDRFGQALTAGDFNKDGRDDLAVGVPGENDQATNDGMVVVFYGTSYGLLRQVNGQWRATAYERLGQKHADARSENGDQFGSALTAGDFNGDGKDDLAVGVPFENDAADDDGMVVVFYGSSSGLLLQENGQWRAARFERLGQKRAGGINEAGDHFGCSLAAGDFDGDGKDDLAIGAPDENVAGKQDAGAVYIYAGSANGLIP
jgi:hypothetical protein